MREYQNRFECRYHPNLTLRLLPNAAGGSFRLTSRFALFHSSALVKVASEPIDEPRNVFVGGLDRDKPGSGGEHESRQQNGRSNYQRTNDRNSDRNFQNPSFFDFRLAFFADRTLCDQVKAKLEAQLTALDTQTPIALRSSKLSTDNRRWRIYPLAVRKI